MRRSPSVMAKGIRRLSESRVANIKEPGLHADGAGLYLSVKKTGAQSWCYIYQWQGKRREKGLGALAAVSLEAARTKAKEARELIDRGLDPLNPPPEPAANVTFGDAADALLKALEPSFENPKHRQQWRNTLTTYCSPIWNERVAEVDTADILEVLSPIWMKVPETANRLRGRIERVLDAAKVRGERTGDNPARWRGHLSALMPKNRKRHEVRHHPAMPYEDVPAFRKQLRTRHSVAARSLEFLILTAGRTGEVLGARWKEIDLGAKVWTMPAERMKMRVEHRVPLTAPAITILEAMKIFGTEPTRFVFPGQKGGQPLTNTAMLMLLRRMKADDYTPHGFRSSFRDWVGEETTFPREIAEAALAHAVGSDVERAYRRGDALAKRRKLMEAWAEYATGGKATASSEA